MIALTQEKREELIFRNSEKLKTLKDAVKQTAYESLREKLEFEIESTEILLASLKAEPIGKFNSFYFQDEMPMFSISEAKSYGIMIGVDYAYASPPVPEVKFPDRDKLPGWARNYDDSLDWYETEIKRLNGWRE